MSWLINYALIGIAFQGLMQWSASKISTENMFNHKERIMLIVGWPIGVLGFIYSFIVSFIKRNE